jgi:hypothetical protein
MIGTGLINLGGVDPEVMKENYINDMKGLTEEAVSYMEKYGD